MNYFLYISVWKFINPCAGSTEHKRTGVRGQNQALATTKGKQPTICTNKPEILKEKKTQSSATKIEYHLIYSIRPFQPKYFDFGHVSAQLRNSSLRWIARKLQQQQKSCATKIVCDRKNPMFYCGNNWFFCAL